MSYKKILAQNSVKTSEKKIKYTNGHYTVTAIYRNDEFVDMLDYKNESIFTWSYPHYPEYRANGTHVFHDGTITPITEVHRSVAKIQRLSKEEFQDQLVMFLIDPNSIIRALAKRRQAKYDKK